MSRYLNLARMRSRLRRRACICVIYLAFFGLLYGSYQLSRWELVAVLVSFIPVSFIFFGERNHNGFVRPFTGHDSSLWYSDDPPPASRIDRWFWRRAPRRSETVIDEREQQLTARAVSFTHRITQVLLVCDLFLFYYSPLIRHENYLNISADLPFGLLLVLVVLNSTLPQAYILWTEPDMEENQ